MREFAPVVVLWLLGVSAAVALTVHGHAQERDRLFERFASRSQTGASFVGAYVDDVFRTEARLGARVSADSWRPGDFVASSALVGFPAGVLLDRSGRAAALAPAAPEKVGVDLASRYPHLSAAMAGHRAVSDVVQSASEGKPIVAFALPLDTGRYRVLSLGFSPADSALHTFLERQPIPGTRGYILDSLGEPIVSAGSGATTAVMKQAQMTSARQRPTVVSGRLLAAAAVPGTPWTYVLDAPVDNVLMPVTSSDRVQWLLLAVMSALTLAGLLVARRAVRARVLARAEKAQADHRLRMTVQNAPIGMAMVDLDHRFVEPNARLCRMLGHSAEELEQLTFEEVTHAEDLDIDLAFVARLDSGESDTYDLERRFVRRDGTLLWGRLAVSVVRDDDGTPLYYVHQVEDVTEFRAAQAELEYRALYDPLTGVANRSLLMDRLTSVLTDTRRPGSVGIGFCDVDHFKLINDTHGHHAGDEVLKEVARRLRASVRDGDTVARMGGDEFILLLTDLGSLTEAEQVMERATRALTAPIEIDGERISVGLSSGLALGRNAGSAETLLRNADAALYAAKKAGRGTCVVYHSLLEETYRDAVANPGPVVVRHAAPAGTDQNQARMEQLIREALEEDAVRVAYQPIFDLSTGLVVGAEALLRLSDRAGLPVSPALVIPAAESSGLIVDVGRRVLDLAAQQVAKWQREHGVLLPVAVNVSAAQLGRSSLPADVLDAVSRAGLPAEALVIELTESVLLRTGSGGMKQLADLRDAGIELAIDDFGTGYASLSLLHELPAATLKIDQSFVAGIPDDRRAVAIVAGVIELAESFGMFCVAEGIENEIQRAYLAERGVLGQGYLLGRPDEDTVIGGLLVREAEACDLLLPGNLGGRRRQ